MLWIIVSSKKVHISAYSSTKSSFTLPRTYSIQIDEFLWYINYEVTIGYARDRILSKVTVFTWILLVYTLSPQELTLTLGAGSLLRCWSARLPCRYNTLPGRTLPQRAIAINVLSWDRRRTKLLDLLRLNTQNILASHQDPALNSNRQWEDPISCIIHMAMSYLMHHIFWWQKITSKSVYYYCY